MRPEVQLLLAVFYFFAINWLGGQSLSIGYEPLSFFDRTATEPAFNFLYRVLAPSVLMLITSAVLYKYSEPGMIIDIWQSVVILVILRAAFQVAWGRIRLISWPAFMLHNGLAVAAAYWSYKSLALNHETFMPDKKTFGNEIWIMISLFVYKALNHVDIRTTAKSSRRESYVLAEYDALQERYDKVVARDDLDREGRLLAYAIIIFEDFNRPRLVRALERATHYFRKRGTYGIMQFTSDVPLSDEESVRKGVALVAELYNSGESTEYWYSRASKVTNAYNLGRMYSEEVIGIWEVLNAHSPRG